MIDVNVIGPFLLGIMTVWAFFIPDIVLALVALASFAFAYYEFVYKIRPYITLDLIQKDVEGDSRKQFFCVFKNVGGSPGYVHFTKARLLIGNDEHITPVKTTTLLYPGDSREFDIGYLDSERMSVINNKVGEKNSVVFEISMEFKGINERDYKYQSNYMYQVKKVSDKLKIVILKEESN